MKIKKVGLKRQLKKENKMNQKNISRVKKYPQHEQKAILAIVIPAYITSEKGARDLHQLYKNLEKQIDDNLAQSAVRVVVVNDHSSLPLSVSPRSMVNLSSWREGENPCGVATARNVGITVAQALRAEFITFIDADDEVPNDCVQILLDRIIYERLLPEEDQADIVQFQAKHEDGNVAYPEPCAWGKLVRLDWIDEDRFDKDQFVGEEDTLFHKPGKTAKIAHDKRIIYQHRQSANPNSLMKRYWRGEIPRRRGEEPYRGDYLRKD